MPQTEPIEIPIEVLDKATQKANELQAKFASFSADATRRAESYKAVEAQKAKAIEESNKALEKQKFSFTELNSAIGLVKQGYAALKGAYDFAEQGAQLEFTKIKFDRLAASIGTTGDVLLGKMKEATRGTLSDMEAMAAATDILSLGLADNQEQAIRLATVQSGLAMDTNQLVLALTNQTTARFDQLGVSVDGFKEKVALLEEQGYSTNDAFTEAFLQQAEEQLLKVGNAADTSLGSYKRLEAQLKNSTNTMKVQASEALLPLVDAWGKQLDEVSRVREALEKTNPALFRQYMLTREITPEMQALITEYENSLNPINNMSKALEETAINLEAMTEANKGALSVMNDLQSAEEKYRETNQKLAEERAEIAAWDIEALDENTRKVQENQAAYEEAKLAILDGLVEQKLMQDGILTDDELNWLIEKREEWGIYSADVAENARAVIQEANNITAAIANIPSSKTSNIYINQITSTYAADNGAGFNAAHPNAHAAGGSFTIPMGYGYEGFKLGNGDTASGGEKLTITPDGQDSNSALLAAIEGNKIDYSKMGRAFALALQQVG